MMSLMIFHEKMVDGTRDDKISDIFKETLRAKVGTFSTVHIDGSWYFIDVTTQVGTRIGKSRISENSCEPYI